jgi:hypothetical protein
MEGTCELQTLVYTLPPFDPPIAFCAEILGGGSVN